MVIFLFLVTLITTCIASHCGFMVACGLLLMILICCYILKKQRSYCILAILIFISVFLQTQYQQAKLANPILHNYKGWAYVQINKPVILSNHYQQYEGTLLIVGKEKVTMPIVLSQYVPQTITKWPEKYWLSIHIKAIKDGKIYAGVNKVIFQHNHNNKWFQMKSQIELWIWQTNGPSQATAILLALALGDRSHLNNTIWLTFARTGTSHLLAIAGLHLGVMVMIVWFMVNWLWRRSQRAMQIVPAQVVSLSIAVIAALGYGIFTGWAIPCERAAMMIAILCLSQMGTFNLTMLDRVLLAFTIIIIFNPVDITAESFWLSLIAVTSIGYGIQNQGSSQSWFKQWLFINAIVTVSLLPWSLYFFAQYAFLAYVANLIAVPWVAFFLLPLVFLSVLIQPVLPMVNMKLWAFCVVCFQPVWSILLWLSNQHVAFIQYQPSFYLCLLYVIGYIWLFAPKAMPGKCWSLLLMLPLLLSAISFVPYATVIKRPLKFHNQHSLLIRSGHHIWLMTSNPAALQLDQWDYKNIAALIGPFGSWSIVRIIKKKQGAYYLDGKILRIA